MVLPLTTEGGRGFRFRLLGFPVRIDLSFVVVMALLGLPAGFDPVRIALWVGIAAVAVIAHELGHALVARTTGAAPEIDLYAFGGLTRFVPLRPMSRARSIAVSLSGPLIGIGIGLVLLVLVPRTDLDAGGLGDYALSVAVFVNLGWGVLNLLPMLPLDGGQVMTELLPGNPAQRRRRAAVVSIAVAVLVAVVAIGYGYYFGAMLAAMFAFGSWQELRPPRQTPAPAPASRETDRAALWLIDSGRYDEARHLVDTAPPTAPADPALAGLLVALQGNPRTGRALVERAVSERPDDAVRVGALVRLLAHLGEWPVVLQLLESPARAVVPPGVGFAAAQAAARAGDTERAFDALSAAVDAGWTDVSATDADEALAPVRATPGYVELRNRMHPPG